LRRKLGGFGLRQICLRGIALRVIGLRKTGSIKLKTKYNAYSLTQVLRYCLAWVLSECGSEYLFSFIHVLSFKVFGIFVNASLENVQQRKAWER